MKRWICMVLALALLALALPAAAAGDGRGQLVRDLAAAVRGKSVRLLDETPMYFGKIVLGICYALTGEPELAHEAWQEDKGYHGLAAENLAESASEADWVVIVYPENTTISGVKYTATRVAAKRMADSAVYGYSFSLEPTRTRLVVSSGASRTADGAFLYDKAIREIAAQLSDNLDSGAAAYYQALALYRQGKYYSAREAFYESGWDDYQARAEACEQKWPRTGEVWRSGSVQGTGMQLTIKVNQAADVAWFARIYRNGSPVSYVFIGGSGEVTVRLPGGTYSIKDGTGRAWFGTSEAFGREGSYEAMTFDDRGSETVQLNNNYSYTLTINVQSANPDADAVGSEWQDWDSFAE